MSILLVGCTGFLGKALLYQLLTRTTYKLFVACRAKHRLMPKRRVSIIIQELGLKSQMDRVRVVPINYNKSFDLAINANLQHKMRNEVSILINALADTRVSTGLKEVISTNTSIALEWLQFLKSCINAKKYDAFVKKLNLVHWRKKHCEEIYFAYFAEIFVFSGDSRCRKPLHSERLTQLFSGIIGRHNNTLTGGSRRYLY